MLKIMGLLIGLLILAAGAYYFVKEKHNAESRKIYGAACAAGAVIALAALLVL